MLTPSFSLISVHLNELQNLMYIRFCHLNLMYGTRVINQNWDTSELGHLVLGEYKGYELQTWTDL